MNLIADLEPDIERVTPRPTGPLFDRGHAPTLHAGFIVPARSATHDQVIAVPAVHAIQTNVFNADRRPDGQSSPPDHVVQVFYGSQGRSMVLGKYRSQDESLSALQSLLGEIEAWENR